MISNSNSSLWSAFLCVLSQALSPPSLLLSVPHFPSWGKGIKAEAGCKAAGLLRVPQAEVPCQKHDQMSPWSENWTTVAPQVLIYPLRKLWHMWDTWSWLWSGWQWDSRAWHVSDQEHLSVIARDVTECIERAFWKVWNSNVWTTNSLWHMLSSVSHV